MHLITGVGIECRDVTTTKLIALLKYPKGTVGILRGGGGGGGGWLCTKN